MHIFLLFISGALFTISGALITLSFLFPDQSIWIMLISAVACLVGFYLHEVAELPDPHHDQEWLSREGSTWEDLTDRYNTHLVENDLPEMDKIERLNFHCALDFLEAEGELKGADTREVKRLREALMFYAELKNHHDTEPHGSSKVAFDGGKQARAALEGQRDGVC